jgi:hypothetical protein
LHSRAQLSTGNRRETSCQEIAVGILSRQIEPGGLNNFAAQLKEGARAARFMRPRFFCPPACRSQFPSPLFSLCSSRAFLGFSAEALAKAGGALFASRKLLRDGPQSKGLTGIRIYIYWYTDGRRAKARQVGWNVTTGFADPSSRCEDRHRACTLYRPGEQDRPFR